MRGTPVPRPVKISPDAAPVAAQIYRRMLDGGFTPMSLSLAAGLGKTYVREIFVGKSKNPKTEQLGRIAKVLGCSVEDLMSPAIGDPRLIDLIKSVAVVPLRPREATLIQIFRVIDDEARERVIDFAASLLPPAKR